MPDVLDTEVRSQRRRSATDVILQALRQPDDSTKQLNKHLNLFAKLYIRHLHEAIPLLAKEVFDYLPLLAPDFDVLHRYFFPSQQSRDSGVSVVHAQRVLDGFPHQIVLLPGTTQELIEHAATTLSLLKRMKVMLESEGISFVHSQQIQALYRDIGAVLRSDSESVGDPTKVIKQLAESFEGLSLGLQRMNRFLSDQRVFSFRELLPDWDVSSDLVREQVAELQAKLSAFASPDARLRTRSIRNDALNLAAAIAIHDQYGTVAAATRHKSLYAVLFVSQTGHLLQVPFEQYSVDTLGQLVKERGLLLDEHLRERDDSPVWRPVTLDAAITYIGLRRFSDQPGDCLWEAKRRFLSARHLSQISLTYDFVANQPSETEDRQLQGTRDSLENLVAPLIGQAFLRDLTRIARASHSREHLPRKVQVAEVRPVAADSDERRKEQQLFASLLTRVLASQPDVLASLEHCGVTIQREMPSPEGSPTACERFSIVDEASGALIYRAETWRNPAYCSFYWATRGTLNEILRWTNQVLRQMAAVNGDVVATYDAPRSELVFHEDVYAGVTSESDFNDAFPPDSHQFRLRGLEESWRLRPEHLRAGYRRLDSDQPRSPTDVVPEQISLCTELGDVHLRLPWARKGEWSFACHTWDPALADLVLVPALRELHMWRWSSKIVTELSQNVRSALQAVSTLQNST